METYNHFKKAITNSTYFETFREMHDSQGIHKCQGLGDLFCAHRCACDIHCRHRNMPHCQIPVKEQFISLLQYT